MAAAARGTKPNRGRAGPAHDPVSLLERLVAIPSHTSEARLQRFLSRLLEGAGFRVTLQEVAPGRVNLVARRGEGGPVLCTHADTVRPFSHPDPFRIRRLGGRLVGRGAVDAKGQLAAVLAAALGTDRPVTVVALADEEGDALGSRRVRLPASARRDGVLVLEPTGFEVCPAQCGYLDLELSVDGPGGHVDARDVRGAVERLLGELGRLSRASRRWAVRPCLVQGGEDFWRASGRARALVHLTLPPGTSLKEARRVARAAGPGVRVRVDDAEPPTTSTGGRMLPALRLALRAAGLAPRRGVFASWSDGAYLGARGYPWVVFGAGHLSSAHSDLEWVAEADLRTLARVLALLIQGWHPAREAGSVRAAPGPPERWPGRGPSS
ncbi:MAG TPA: M20/M25/M40 family metallo-hydrolase [Actinomycetota bacterium]|nr:M20/M25/M40 family metallo-hydrolase [Actinomycetota bacterium]